MSERKLNESLENLSRAMARLEEALLEDISNSLMVDGIIQRFEFALELLWKTLKRALQNEGIEATSPRDVLKESYALRWVDDEALWLAMMKIQKYRGV